jgi:hypothetical protein
MDSKVNDGMRWILDWSARREGRNRRALAAGENMYVFGIQYAVTNLINAIVYVVKNFSFRASLSRDTAAFVWDVSLSCSR